MTKDQLIKEVAREAVITLTAAQAAVNLLAETIVSEVQSTGRFALPGVGVFTLKKKAARPGRNPQTGETIEIEAKNTVKFKPSDGFKRAVNS